MRHEWKREPMNHVDLALLDATEWLCRRFQLLTGRTNVWLAVQLTNLSIVLYFVWAGVAFWGAGTLARVGVVIFCGGLLYALSQTVLKEPIDSHEQNAYRRVAKGLRNPRRLRDAPLRIAFLTLSTFLFYPVALAWLRFRIGLAALSYSLVVLTTVVLYLLACDPLPPCAGRVRLWLGRLIPSRPSPSESIEGARPVRRFTNHEGRSRG
jgi:hypothetical protein